MPNLQDLPEELLLAIIKAVQENFDHNSLLNLAVVCKRLTPLVRVALVQRCSVDVAADDSAHLPKHVLQFLRFLRKYPELLDCLDWVQLGWDRKPRLSKSFNDLVTLMAKSQSLKRLSIGLASQAQLAEIPVLFQPPPNSFCKLEWIDVDADIGGDIAADYMVKLCELPNLRRITNTTSNIVACSSPHMLESPEVDIQKTPLKLRYLESLAPMVHMDYLKLVLPRTKRLEALHISLPGPGVRRETQYPESRWVWFPDTTHQFSPHEIGKYLKHASKSLESLSISTMRHVSCNWDTTFVHPAEHDNTYLDLSRFEKIYEVILSSYLFFGNHRSAAAEHQVEHRKIWELIPPNIEQLQINFEGHQGIFSPLDQMYDTMIDNEEGFIHYWGRKVANCLGDTFQLGWLFELLEEVKEGRFPHLHEIVLEECYSSLWGKWELINVTELYEELASHRIQIAVRIMVPEDMAAKCMEVLRARGFEGGFDTSFEDRVWDTLAAKGFILNR